jgi:hypothetical protein
MNHKQANDHIDHNPDDESSNLDYLVSNHPLPDEPEK